MTADSSHQIFASKLVSLQAYLRLDSISASTGNSLQLEHSELGVNILAHHE